MRRVAEPGRSAGKHVYVRLIVLGVAFARGGGGDVVVMRAEGERGLMRGGGRGWMVTQVQRDNRGCPLHFKGHKKIENGSVGLAFIR